MLALAGAGCGGDGTDGTGGAGTPSETVAAGQADTTVDATTAQLSKAQFVARANQVCREDREEMLAKVGEYRRSDELTKSPGPPFARETADVYLIAIQFMFDHINFGGLPQGDEARASRMLSTLERTFVDAMEHRFYSPAQLSARFHRFNHMAKRYGLSDCVIAPAFFRRA